VRELIRLSQTIDAIRTHGGRIVRWCARFFIRFSQAVDAINARFGIVADWCVLLAALVSAGNAFSRYLFSYSSNGFLEAQWYLFGALVLLGAPYTFRLNEHVRVDVIYSAIPPRARLMVDIFGLTVFLLPAMIFLAYLTWGQFWVSFRQGEMSSQYGGLIRWPIKLVLPLGFALLVLQGLSELIKRIAALAGEGAAPATADYERPVQ
jgi:TRAP-type mannitol/chloroaromatic compound transport system permease small subunit